MVPSIRSRRAVSNGGPLLSVAYDLTCFKRFVERYKRRLENARMRLSMVKSIRSRPVVPKGGPHLSVAYDLVCFMQFFDLVRAWSILDQHLPTNIDFPKYIRQFCTQVVFFLHKFTN